MRPWEADPSAAVVRRWGKSPQELGVTNGDPNCPDILELDNGDVAIIGRDLTDTYTGKLPDGVSVGADERLVVIPRSTMISAKADIPNA
jgi:hypothetical protein